jgi:hypothetical protein
LAGNEDDDVEETPMQPRKLNIQQESFLQQSFVPDTQSFVRDMDRRVYNFSDQQDADDSDGKVNYPNKGNPFHIIDTYYRILPHDFWYPCTVTTMADNKDGTLEISTPKVSECKRLYKESNNFIQLLLCMCIGIVNEDEDEDEDQAIADLENDPVYRDHLEKMHHPKVPMLKAEMKRRDKSNGSDEVPKELCS